MLAIGKLALQTGMETFGVKMMMFEGSNINQLSDPEKNLSRSMGWMKIFLVLIMQTGGIEPPCIEHKLFHFNETSTLVLGA